MNIYDFAPIRALIAGAYWAVTALADLFEPLTGEASAACAVVALTVLVRIVLIPVGRSQVKAGIVRQRLAPRIAELQRRHRKSPELLQRKLAELYATEKASPFAGCLPVLAQTPVLMAVYGLFILPVVDGHPNDLLAHTLLGVPLGDGLVGMISSGQVTWGAAALFAAIMVVIATVAQASRRLLAPPQPVAPAAQPTGAAPTGAARTPDLSGLTKALSFLPFMTAIIAAFVPLAAGLYLMTTTAWTLGERLVLTRLLREPVAEAS